MKTRLFLMIATAMWVMSECKAQDKLYVSAGTTFSAVKGNNFKLKDRFGYYAGFGVTAKASRQFNVTTEIQLMNQRASNDTLTFHSNSLNLSAYYKYHPFSFKLNILFGIQMGFIMNSSIKAQDTTIRDRDVRFSGVGGLSYELNKFEVLARYNHRFDGNDIFKSPLQAGVVYKLNNK